MSCAYAKTSLNDANLRRAMLKYKNKDIVGCLQDMEDIQKRDPSNAVAQYYIALVYANMGKKDDAIAAYDKVIAISNNKVLNEFANNGKTCLLTPEQCYVNNVSDIEKFIENPTKIEDPNVKQVNERVNGGSNTEQLKQDINDEVDQWFNDRKNKQQNGDGNGNNLSAVPSDNDIKNAVNVLSRAGINVDIPQNTSVLAQNSQYQQLQMLLNMNNSNNKSTSYNGNSMDWLPFMLSLNNNNPKNKVTPEMIQSMMMTSAYQNFDFDIKN